MADIVNDEEIRSVKDLTDAFHKLGLKLEEIIVSASKQQAAVNQDKTVKDLIKRIEALEGEQKKLIDTNKRLTDAQNKNAQAIANQGEAMEILDNRTNGMIGRTKELGKQFLTLAKSPIILTLVAIAAAIAACVAAYKTFTQATGEGEEIADRQRARRGALFSSLKKNFKEACGFIARWFESVGGMDGLILGTLNGLKLIFPALSGWIQTVTDDYIKLNKEAQKYTIIQQDLDDQIA